MMRVFGLFGGLLTLFVLICGFEDVFLSCNEHWLQVRIKQKPCLCYQQPLHYEIYLGPGQISLSSFTLSLLVELELKSAHGVFSLKVQSLMCQRI